MRQYAFRRLLRVAFFLIVVLAGSGTGHGAEKDTMGPQRSAGEMHLTTTEGMRPSVGIGAGLPPQSTPLEDLLLEKGVISHDEWLRTKAEEERRTFERLTE